MAAVTPRRHRPQPGTHRGREVGHVPVGVAVHLLEPGHAAARRRLGLLQRTPALPLVGVQGTGQVVRPPEEAVRERHRVEDRQPGAGADREVGGVGGVADQDDAVVVPALVDHLGEVPPLRRLTAGRADQAVPPQRPGEDLFHQRGALRGGRRGEPEAVPGLLPALDDEGAGPGARRVGVAPDPPRRGLDEVEHERAEHPVGAQPDVGVPAGPDRGAERAAVEGAHPAVRAVRGDHEIGGRKVGRLGDLLLVEDLDAQVGGPLGEDPLHGRPAHAVAVTAEVGGPPAHPDLLLLPQRGHRPQPAAALGVVAVEGVEQVVLVDDTPAVGRAGRIAVEDSDLVSGVAQLGGEGEVQAGGSPADAHDLHEVVPSTGWETGCGAGSGPGGTSARR